MTSKINPYEQELLLSAQEGTFLIDMRNGTDSIQEPDISVYRQELGGALLLLVNDNRIATEWREWMADSGTPIEPADLMATVIEGRAWDNTAAHLIYLTVASH